MTTTIKVPELSLVVLIGASGSGKSSFASKHFKSTEIISSDFCRGLVADDENDQTASNEAFDVLHFIARKRLARGQLTVIDATNVEPENRKHLVAIAREFHALPVTITMRRVPIANSVRTSCAISKARCAARCASSERKGSATSTSSNRSRTSIRRQSSASRSTTIASTSMDRSTSSATCTAASTS
jgi:predicted kinase